MNIHFAKANPEDLSIIYSWLDKPFIKEFWDNSPDHRKDIQIFTEGRTNKSTYFNGIFTYWVGFIDNEPFALLMTAIIEDDEDCPQLWKKHLPESGAAYSIDFCIGNERFFGKGLGAATLKAFTSFFKQNIAKDTSAFFIDPDENNPRAEHVYAKAGFKRVGEYANTSGYFEGQQSILMILTV